MLDRLAVVELRLGFSKLARQYWSELAERQPENLLVRAAIFDLRCERAIWPALKRWWARCAPSRAWRRERSGDLPRHL